MKERVAGRVDVDVEHTSVDEVQHAASSTIEVHERKLEKEEKNKRYHRIERSYGTFLRNFALPEGADGAKVIAEFKDGVLNVHLPKNEKAKSKAIDVKVS